MANPDAPFGFRKVNTLAGHQPSTVRTFGIKSGYATALYIGHAVKMLNDGTIGIAAAGGAILGILRGVSYRTSTGEHATTKYWPASTTTFGSVDAVAEVDCDPNGLWEVQSDGAIVAADIGQLVDIDTSQSGDATTGQSKMQITTVGGSEASFAVVGVYGAGIWQKPCRNAAGNQDMLAVGTNAVAIVKPVVHQLGTEI
jgi:hypothetical protein